MPRRFATGTLISAADQALLSLFSLALALAFIRGTDKHEFATFTLMFVVVQLMQSVQNALVSSPLLTMCPARADLGARNQVFEAGLSLQRQLMLAVLLVSAGIAVTVVTLGRVEWALLACATGLAVLGVMSREIGRTAQFLRLAPHRALAGDLVYVLLAAAGMLATFAAGMFSAPAALAVVGLAGLISTGGMALAGHGVREGQRPKPAITTLVAERQAIWACSRWALPSVVNSWFYANAFLYAVEAGLGKDAVADISAARLLLVPLTLVLTAWTMTFRPRAASWLSGGEGDRVHHAASRSLWVFLAISLAYGAVLAAAWPTLLQPLFGPAYQGLEGLLAMWLLFFTVASVRGVGMNAMLASASAYRTLFYFGLAGTGVAVLGVSVALVSESVVSVLAALVMAEATLALLIWLQGWPAIRRSVAPATNQY